MNSRCIATPLLRPHLLPHSLPCGSSRGKKWARCRQTSERTLRPRRPSAGRPWAPPPCWTGRMANCLWRICAASSSLLTRRRRSCSSSPRPSNLTTWSCPRSGRECQGSGACASSSSSRAPEPWDCSYASSSSPSPSRPQACPSCCCHHPSPSHLPSCCWRWKTASPSPRGKAPPALGSGCSWSP